MTITDKTSVLADYIKTQLYNSKNVLGLADVLYGFHTDIPTGPVAVVMPGVKSRDLVGASAPGGKTRNYMTVIVDIHTDKVGSEGVNRLLTDQLAETIEDFLHTDVKMNDLIIHGFVQEWRPAETTFVQGGEYRTVRLTFVGMSETYLSS